MGKRRLEAQTTEDENDEWLTTRNKRKISPHASSRKPRGRQPAKRPQSSGIRSPLSTLQDENSAQKPAATHQTSLLSFFPQRLRPLPPRVETDIKQETGSLSPKKTSESKFEATMPNYADFDMPLSSQEGGEATPHGPLPEQERVASLAPLSQGNMSHNVLEREKTQYRVDDGKTESSVIVSEVSPRKRRRPEEDGNLDSGFEGRKKLKTTAVNPSSPTAPSARLSGGCCGTSWDTSGSGTLGPRVHSTHPGVARSEPKVIHSDDSRKQTSHFVSHSVQEAQASDRKSLTEAQASDSDSQDTVIMDAEDSLQTPAFLRDIGQNSDTLQNSCMPEVQDTESEIPSHNFDSLDCGKSLHFSSSHASDLELSAGQVQETPVGHAASSMAHRSRQDDTAPVSVPSGDSSTPSLNFSSTPTLDLELDCSQSLIDDTAFVSVPSGVGITPSPNLSNTPSLKLDASQTLADNAVSLSVESGSTPSLNPTSTPSLGLDALETAGETGNTLVLTGERCTPSLNLTSTCTVNLDASQSLIDTTNIVSVPSADGSIPESLSFSSTPTLKLDTSQSMDDDTVPVSALPEETSSTLSQGLGSTHALTHNLQERLSTHDSCKGIVRQEGLLGDSGLKRNDSHTVENDTNCTLTPAVESSTRSFNFCNKRNNDSDGDDEDDDDTPPFLKKEPQSLGLSSGLTSLNLTSSQESDTMETGSAGWPKEQSSLETNLHHAHSSQESDAEGNTQETEKPVKKSIHRSRQNVKCYIKKM